MKTHISRIYDNLSKYMWDGNITVVYGPRRVGKTTLVKQYLSTKTKQKIYTTSGEERTTIESLSSQSLETIKDFVGDYDYIFIDEAQAIPNVGVGLKLLIDHFPDKKVIITGSSSFNLSRKVGEPLTGRQHQLTLYPISIQELVNTHGKNQVKSDVVDYLTFGMYPEIRTIDGRDNKIAHLKSLVESYLLKDILQFAEVQNVLALRRLLTSLAYQIGSPVSLNELSSNLQIDVKTVQRYIDLLTQSFVIYPLGSFSRNLRSEMVQKRKYYFYDVGIRNALIGDYNDPFIRGDIGGLFENFIILERLKYRAYGKLFYANDYFWKDNANQEIDLVESYDGKLNAFEIKWNPKNKPRSVASFTEAYGSSPVAINRDNFLQFLSD